MTDRDRTLRQRWIAHRKAAAGNFLAVAILNLCALLTLTPCLAQPPVEAGKPIEFSQLKMRRVSVPIDQLDVILARDRRGVLLPRDEFLKLYTAAQRRAQDRRR